MCVCGQSWREKLHASFQRGSGVSGAQQVLHGERTRRKLAVELLLLVFAAFNVLAEGKETRNGDAA